MFFFFNFSVIKNVLNYLHINDDVREKSIVRNIFSTEQEHMLSLNIQGRSQNLKEVPQNFTEVLNIDDVTANEPTSQRKKLSFFHFYGKNTVIVRSLVHGYACILESLHYFDKTFTAHFQATFTFSKYE